MSGASPAAELAAAFDLQGLRRLAVTIADEAAALLVGGVEQARASVDTKSSSTDMVTALDKASEALILERLLDARPDDGVLGEEGAAVEGTSGLEWVVDPLDGTTNYLYQYPFWNVSIGARVGDHPVVGVVAIPSLRERYSAALGSGATCNGATIMAADPPPLAASLVGTGFGYAPEIRVQQARAMVEIIGRVRDVRRGGAAAADLCMLAVGRLDAYYEWGLSPWDRVAGQAIAGEAGRRVEVVAQSAVTDRCLTVGAHRSRFDEWCELLERCGITDADTRQ